MPLKLHGNGLIVQSLDGKHSIKVSGLDRSISKSKLEKRFVYFKDLDASMAESAKPASEYAAAPLQKDPDRNGLYQRYLAGIINPAIVEISSRTIKSSYFRLYEITG